MTRLIPLFARCSATSLLASVICSIAFAQQSDIVEPDEAVIEQITVTGSRIKRRDLDAPSPISTIDRDTIAASAQGTLEELLNQMPQLTPDFGRTSNNPGNGSAQLNLRGLGPGRSLVMLNSRRLAPSGVGSAVDVNNIPQALIERVEIITGGASTVYGSDALAGVINFITRDDFQGFSLQTTYSLTEEGDGGYTDISLAYGSNFANGRGNVTVFGGFYDRQSLYAGARPFSSVPVAEDREIGELFEGGSPITPSGVITTPPVDWGLGPAGTTFDPNGVPRVFDDKADLYNFAAVNYLQTPLQRYNAGVLASIELGETAELYIETAIANNQSARELAPTPAWDITIVNINNPLLTPETQQLFADNFEVIPNIAGFFMLRRLDELGPRQIENEREYWRSVVGLRGEIGRGWEYDAWITYTRSDEKELLFGDASRTRYLQGLLVPPETGNCYDPSGGCVPIDIFGPGRISPESVEFVRFGPLPNLTERKQKLASFFVTGPLFELYAGTMEIAVGAEWRSDEAHFEADDALLTGDTLGFRGDASVNGTETVSEAYIEALVPIFEGANGKHHINLELGGRISSYDFAGIVGTHKIGVTWRAHDNLRFRAMYQYSVRAPNNQEQFQEQYIEPGFFVTDNPNEDACSASQDPIGSGYTEACMIQGLTADQLGVFEAARFYPANWIYGGNSELQQEIGETYTIGAVFTPKALDKWSFAVDLYEIDIRDGIGLIAPRDICFDLRNTSNKFCDKITRDATGNVVQVERLQQNKAVAYTRGVDTQIHYGTELPDSLSITSDGAELGIYFIWTAMLNAKNQEDFVSSKIECSGLFESVCGGVNGTAVRNRLNANFNYRSGPARLSLSTRWIEGTDSFAAIQHQYYGGTPPVLAIEHVPSKIYADLHIGYDINDRISLGFNIENLLNEEPPLMPHIWSNNTDTLLYDVFGRSYSLNVKMNLGN